MIYKNILMVLIKKYLHSSSEHETFENLIVLNSNLTPSGMGKFLWNIDWISHNEFLS